VKCILLVHGSLQMGGVETLLVRLAREFSARGVAVRVLLFGRAADPRLLAELKQYAVVAYLDELISPPSFGDARLAVLAGLLSMRPAAKRRLLDGVQHVHFTESLTMMLCARLLECTETPLRVTGGVYSQYEFVYPSLRPSYCVSSLARHFAFHAATGRILFFGGVVRKLVGEHIGRDLSACPILPIGIDLKRHVARDPGRVRRMKLVAIGRITGFKSYNIHFLTAVAQLRRAGVPVEYHVYGEGDAIGGVRRRIDELGLASCVHLHGNVDYNRFAEVIADAGLLVGSGTALLEAAACGVPALIGIEAQPDDRSYGFLHEMEGFAYHEQGIDHPLTPFAEHVERMLALDDEGYRRMCEASVRKAQQYSIERLVDGWLALDERLVAAGSGNAAPGLSGPRFVASLLWERLALPLGLDSGFWRRFGPGPDSKR